MSNRIVYPGAEPACAKSVHRPNAFRPMLAAFLLLFTLGVRMLWPAGTEVLRQWLLPGQGYSAQQALDTLAGQLARGDTVAEAVTAFCRDILHARDA